VSADKGRREVERRGRERDGRDAKEKSVYPI